MDAKEKARVFTDAASPEPRIEKAVMEFIQLHAPAVLTAAVCAAQTKLESEEQRAVILIDMSDGRARSIVETGVREGRVSPVALTADPSAIVLVATASAARDFVCGLSSLVDAAYRAERFDAAAQYAATTWGMLLVVLSNDQTLVASMPRVGREIGKA